MHTPHARTTAPQPSLRFMVILCHIQHTPTPRHCPRNPNPPASSRHRRRRHDGEQRRRGEVAQPATPAAAERTQAHPAAAAAGAAAVCGVKRGRTDHARPCSTARTVFDGLCVPVAPFVSANAPSPAPAAPRRGAPRRGAGRRGGRDTVQRVGPAGERLFKEGLGRERCCVWMVGWWMDVCR